MRLPHHLPVHEYKINVLASLVIGTRFLPGDKIRLFFCQAAFAKSNTEPDRKRFFVQLVRGKRVKCQKANRVYPSCPAIPGILPKASFSCCSKSWKPGRNGQAFLACRMAGEAGALRKRCLVFWGGCLTMNRKIIILSRNTY